MKTHLTVICVMLLMGASLAACGRKGQLEAPPGTPAAFPQQYPDPSEY